MVDVNVNEELANRLGITNSSVSQIVAGAFDGGPVSTFWEGDRPVTILLRLTPAARSSFGNLSDTYVSSQVTKARVPLRAISTLKPEWQSSRIVRRNGVRTLTVRSFVQGGHYASELLNAVQQQIDRLPLPPGYRIEYGGDKLNSEETLPEMVMALGISLVAIFLVLLIQFKKVSDTLIVMSSIPLAMPGAALGLVVTHNPFGFTAFMGVISLCGIVVRNAIILVDYINEKMHEGHPLDEAATEAGERRLRPIFLTTMAAAVGVLPMILSGSSLWSPLASVIAVGLIWSMFMTLLVVPVLFAIVKSRLLKPASAALAAALIAGLILAPHPASAETRRLTLPEAVELALKGNSSLKIARFKVDEKGKRVAATSADKYPNLSNYTWYMGTSESNLVSIPLPGVGTIPVSENLNNGSSSFFLNGTVLSQPLTQLIKINEATGIARSDQRVAQADVRKAENDVVFAVHHLYYGLLVAQKQKKAAEEGLAAAQENLREVENAVRARNLLEVAITEGRTALLQNKQSLLAANIRIADLSSELNHLLGLPLETELELADPGPSERAVQSRGHYLQAALSGNPQIASAKHTVEKAKGGVNAARYEYIPDLTLFAANTYQEGASFATHNVGTFGLMMTWNIWDWGKRRSVVGERKAQLAQAEENLHRVNEQVTVELDKAYRKLEDTKSMLDVAREALTLQRERLRLASDQLKAATITFAKYSEVAAAAKKAEADELQARMGHEIAIAEVNRIAGTINR